MKKININPEKIYITRGINNIIEEKPGHHTSLGFILHDFSECRFHSSMDAEDLELNMQAVEEQSGRVLAPYVLDGKTIWIIHYFEDKTTTILLPEEY